MRYWKETALLLSLVSLALSIRTCVSEKQSKNIMSEAHLAASSEMSIEIDNRGREIAEMNTIVVENKKQLKELAESGNERVKRLEGLLKRRGKVSYGAIIETQTDQESASETIIIRDTVSAIVVYTGHYEDEYLTWNGRADPDSFKVDVSVRNEFEFTQSTTNPWFKKSKTSAQLKNLNTHTTTKELFSFVVDEPVKRFGIGPYIGVTPTVEASFTKVSLKPQIGIGLHYDILQVK